MRGLFTRSRGIGAARSLSSRDIGMQRQARDEPRQAPTAGGDAPSARNEAVALAAYHAALGEFGEYAHSRRLLLERLGDVDGQATHPVAAARLTLAGRLIAAAQLAEPVRLPELHVHGIVRAWLANREAERDDAAPSITRRVAPEEERVHGLTQRLIDCEYDGGFSRTAWGIAGMVLQHLIRPTVEVSRALGVRATLEPLAAAARDLPSEPDTAPHALLAATAIRLRVAGRVVTDPAAGRDERQRAWLAIAGDTARAHARWAQGPIDRSMAEALARATERLASSLVPDEPDRFDHACALEHAIQAAFDAAVMTLGIAAKPSDPVFVPGKADLLETLMEAVSSALICAWVAAH
jgi:hypothetical protein